MSTDDLFEKFKTMCTKNNKDDTKKKPDKKLFNMIVLVLVGVMLVIVSSLFKSTNTLNVQKENIGEKKTIEDKELVQSQNADEKELQSQLKGMLQKIDGVGNVELMIYFESSEEQIPAVNSNDSKSFTEENDTSGGKRNIKQESVGKTIVMNNNGNNSEPMILKKYKPKITGAVIVAEGAEVKVTELRITQAVMKLFNLPERKICVYPMKK